MRTYEKETIPVREVERCTGVECDRCGRKGRCSSIDYGEGLYDVAECEVKVVTKSRVGVSYPEGGEEEVRYVDACPDCFETVIAPALTALGFTVRTKKGDW